MNILHDVEPGTKDSINVIIEIPKGSKNKYEIDKKTGLIALDRVSYTAQDFPFDYGFVPQTWSEDHDAMDIVVLSSEPISTGILVECKIIGMLATEDEEGGDAKLIAVPKAKIDPSFAHINDIGDLPESLKNKVKHFYENYKSIEPGKWVKVTDWKSKEDAIKAVEEAIGRYSKKFSK